MTRTLSSVIIIAAVALVATGCLGDSAQHHAKAKIPPHGLLWGDIDGHVITTTCPGTSGTPCPQHYVGGLRFCPAGDSFGPCKQARVDETGRFHVQLETMMWRVTPKPAPGNVVTVRSKRFVIGGGQTLTMTLDGSVPEP